MNEQAAEEIFRELHESYKRVSVCIHEVFERGSYAQARDFRKLAGDIMGRIIIDFFMPITHEHPHLEPAELKNVEGTAPQPLPTSVGASILAAVSELQSRLERLAADHFPALPADELSHYQQSSQKLMGEIELARDFVARATQMRLTPRSTRQP